MTLAELETSGAVARQDLQTEGEVPVTLIDTAVSAPPGSVLNRNGGGGDGAGDGEGVPSGDGSTGSSEGTGGGSGGGVIVSDDEQPLKVDSAVFNTKGRTGTVIRPVRNGGG